MRFSTYISFYNYSEFVILIPNKCPQGAQITSTAEMTQEITQVFLINNGFLN